MRQVELTVSVDHSQMNICKAHRDDANKATLIYWRLISDNNDAQSAFRRLPFRDAN